jgi:sterol desaturase/sphingolipid hydroxylase (fatty acid hydroxylase superfamily)
MMIQMGLNFVFALVCAVWSHDAFLVKRRTWGWLGLFLSAANFASGLVLLMSSI